MKKADAAMFRAALPEMLALVMEEIGHEELQFETYGDTFVVFWMDAARPYGSCEQLILLGKRGDTFIWEVQ